MLLEPPSLHEVDVDDVVQRRVAGTARDLGLGYVEARPEIEGERALHGGHRGQREGEDGAVGGRGRRDLAEHHDGSFPGRRSRCPGTITSGSGPMRERLAA